MDDFYRNATTKMEDAGVNDDYVLGWQGGYLGHPERESQRTSDAYTAGYADGKGKNADNFNQWIS